MIRRLSDSLTRIWHAIKARWHEMRHGEKPPMRSGCVYVEIYAAPQSKQDTQHMRRVRALIKAHQTGRQLSTEEVDYWADRYNLLKVRRMDCSFSDYLKAPYYYEAVLQARTAHPHAPKNSTLQTHE